MNTAGINPAARSGELTPPACHEHGGDKPRRSTRRGDKMFLFPSRCVVSTLKERDELSGPTVCLPGGALEGGKASEGGPQVAETGLATLILPSYTYSFRTPGFASVAQPGRASLL
jgi:hypothetical protein